jgi:hypothetical protein
LAGGTAASCTIVRRPRRGTGERGCRPYLQPSGSPSVHQPFGITPLELVGPEVIPAVADFSRSGPVVNRAPGRSGVGRATTDAQQVEAPPGQTIAQASATVQSLIQQSAGHVTGAFGVSIRKDIGYTAFRRWYSMYRARAIVIMLHDFPKSV